MKRSVIIACLLLSLAAALPAAERPNIVLILTDDLNTQVLRDGSPVRVPTPNLDRLRARGVSFRNAHAVSPICGPSRAGMLCGYYPQTSGYWGWKQNGPHGHWRKNALLGRAPTIVEHARDNGYLVAGGGKIFHNGHHDASVFMDGDRKTYGPMDSHGPWPLKQQGPAWKFWTSHPDFAGMGQFGFYTPLSNVPRVPSAGDFAGYDGWGDHGGPFRYDGPDDRDPMPDERLARWAARWIGDHSDERPFLLCIGFNRPHSPWVVPDAYFERFPLDQVEVMPVLADDTADNAAELQPPNPDTATRAGLKKYRLIVERDGDVRQWTRAYMACVSFIDDQLGVVLDAIDASPTAGQTIIIFTSDHGYHMGEKQRVFKNTLWEPSTSIPLIVAGPGMQAGGESHRPVSLIDVYPTIAEAARLPAERRGEHLPPLDGLSLLSLCRDVTAPWGRSVALSNVPSQSKPDDDPALAIPHQHWSVRGERFRYVRGNAGGEELYDLQADPREWHNLADDPAYAADKQRLRAAMHALVGPSLGE